MIPTRPQKTYNIRWGGPSCAGAAEHGNGGPPMGTPTSNMGISNVKVPSENLEALRASGNPPRTQPTSATEMCAAVTGRRACTVFTFGTEEGREG